MPSTQKNKDSETKRSTLSSKVASMATAASTDDLAMMLAKEMVKQREYFKEDMAELIESSLAPIQASIATFHETMDTLGKRVTSVEITTGDNFEALAKAEKAITDLQAMNATLVDRMEDMENRSRRANLRIINVPEASDTKDMVTHVSTLLKDVMGSQFNTLPELDRAHRILTPKPKSGQPPRPIIVAFHRYQDCETDHTDWIYGFSKACSSGLWYVKFS